MAAFDANASVFQDIMADSDSDDDLPLADLVPLIRNHRENIDGSLDDDNNDLELAEPEVNMDEDVNNEAPVNVNIDFTSALAHEWLGNFSKDHGQRLGAGDLTEIQVFEGIFTPDVLDLFVTETNRYAEQYFLVHPKDTLPVHSLPRKWVATDRSEMAAFLGILYFMGYIKLPTYHNYWSTEYLTEIRGFRAIMSRDRWLVIWQFFHVANNDDCLPRDHPNFDRLFKIKPLVEILLQKWQNAYYPGQHVSVDESIVAYKGRASMIQYNPQKPHKWGIKAWVLSESKTGYMYNWEIYRGGTAGRTEHGLSRTVVTNITKPIYGNKHHVYMDNFFSSPDLFEFLAEQRLGACGTLRANRIGVPVEIKNVQKTLKREDPPVFVRDGKQLFIAWQDKKCVNVITTLHNEETFSKTVRCKDATTNFRREIIKPKAVELYNQNMGGVDLADQKLQVYLNVHRTVKWWKKVAIYLLEATFVNAYIIWKARNEGPANHIRADKFRLAVIKGLVGNHQRHLGPPRHIDAPFRLVGRHFVGINPNKTPLGKRSLQDCVVCSVRVKGKKRHQTQYMCILCDTPLCPYPCFERYHTLSVYKIKCTKALHSK